MTKLSMFYGETLNEEAKLIIWRRASVHGKRSATVGAAGIARAASFVIGCSGGGVWRGFHCLPHTARQKRKCLWLCGGQSLLRGRAEERQDAVHLRSASG